MLRNLITHIKSRRNLMRTFAYLLSAILVIIGGVGILLGHQAATSLQTSIIEADNQMLNQVQSSMNIVMQHNDRIHLKLITDTYVSNFIDYYLDRNVTNLVAASKTIYQMFLSNTYLVSVDIYYPGHQLVYIGNSGVVEADYYPDEYLLSLIDNQEMPFNWIYNRRIYDIHTQRHVEVTTELFPLSYVRDQLYSVAVINFSRAYLTEMLDSLSIRNEISIVVLDKSGRFIAASSGWDERMSSDLGNKVAQFEDGNYYTDFNGERFFITYQDDPIRSWKYVSLTPEKVIFQPMKSIQLYSIVVIAIGLLIGILVSVVLSFQLLKPFTRIAHSLGFNVGDRTDILQYIETNITDLKARSDTIEKVLQEHLPIMTNQFLADLLAGFYKGSDEIYEKLDYYTIPFDRNASYCVFVILLDVQQSSKTRYSQQQLNLFSIFTTQLIHDQAQQPGDLITVNTKGNEIAVIAKIGELGPADQNKTIESMCRLLAANLAESMKYIQGIGAGNAVALDVVDESYMLAEAALARRFILSKSRLIFSHQQNKAARSFLDYPAEEEYRLISLLKRGKMDDANEQLGYIVSILYLPGVEGESIRPYYLIRLLSTLLDVARSIGVIMATTESLYETMLTAAQNEDDALSWFRQLAEDILTSLAHPDSERDRRLSNELIAYINDNYADCALSLQKLSEEFYFSTAYISRIFREETGGNIKQYITEIRMEQAKNLLSELPVVKISDVGAMVGYDNVHSFLKAFKKYIGLTPSQYRERS